MVISTIPDVRVNIFLIKNYRKKNKEGTIIVTAHDIKKATLLYEAGATYVLIPYLFGAHAAAEMFLKSKNNPSIFEEEKQLQFRTVLSD